MRKLIVSLFVIAALGGATGAVAGGNGMPNRSWTSR